jgi:hypothetical protein
MTQSLNRNFVLASLATLGIGCATAVNAPDFLGASFAFGGGLLGGASIANDRARRRDFQSRQSERVTSTFAALYELNRGVLDPVQLSFMANIPLDQAHGFLTNVAENTGGQKVPTKSNNGVLFTFPHSQNALDELSKNAENWAKAQTQQLQEQLEKQQKVLQLMQLRQTAAQQQAALNTDPDPWMATGQPGL